MEQEWFSWEDWDQLDTMVFGFHKCVLKMQIGPFLEETVIPYIQVSYEDGKIAFLKDDGETMFEAKMKVSFE